LQELDKAVFEANTSIKANFVEIQLGWGAPKVNAWGENHLWVENRKVLSLSGLGESRIPPMSATGASIACPRFIAVSLFQGAVISEQ